MKKNRYVGSGVPEVETRVGKKSFLEFSVLEMKLRCSIDKLFSIISSSPYNFLSFRLNLNKGICKLI